MENDFNLVTLRKQTPGQLALYFLSNLPSILPFNHHKKQSMKSSTLFPNIILLFNLHNLLPFLNFNSEIVSDLFLTVMMEIHIGQWQKYEIIKPSMLGQLAHFLLEGQIERSRALKLCKTVKKPIDEGNEKIIGILEKIENMHFYQIKQKVTYLKISNQRISSMKIILQNEYRKNITNILIKTLNLSRYEITKNNILKQADKLILNKGSLISGEYSLIYVQKGELLLHNIQQSFKYSVLAEGIIDIFQQEKLYQIKAMVDSAVLCLSKTCLLHLIQIIPSFDQIFAHNRQKLKIDRKDFFTKKETPEKDQTDIDYVPFRRQKWKNRFSKRKNSSKENTFDPEFRQIADGISSQKVIESKQKVLKLMKEAEGKKEKKIFKRLQNDSDQIRKLFQHEKLRKSLNKKLTQKNKSKRKSGLKNEELFFTNLDIGLAHNFSINSDEQDKELVTTYMNSKKEKFTRSASTRVPESLKLRTLSNKMTTRLDDSQIKDFMGIQKKQVFSKTNLSANRSPKQNKLRRKSARIIYSKV